MNVLLSMVLSEVGVGGEFGEDFVRMFLLRDWNTLVVVVGVTLLGLASGVTGTFMLLRKRALVAEAVSHATLPGIAAAFILMVLAGGTGRYLPGLLAGAAFFGLLGIVSILIIRQTTRLKDDTALAIVLSVFFGLGVVMLGLIQDMNVQAAGVDRFIFGKAATMLFWDGVTIIVITLLVLGVTALLFKEFALVCFDAGFARSQGWPVLGIDVTMMGLALTVTVVGLQAVGLILIVAMLIIPPAAARFWTDRLLWMALIAGGIGMVSGYAGAMISGVMPGDVPTGPVIILAAAGVFVASLLLAPQRGLIARGVRQVRLVRRTGMQHLLRAIYETLDEREQAGRAKEQTVRTGELLERRSWSQREVERLLRIAERAGLVESVDAQHCRLSAHGYSEAQRLVRNHRLWEHYLIRHAQIAPSHVDRDADHIEHVLGEQLVGELEAELAVRGAEPVPPSPHRL